MKRITSFLLAIVLAAGLILTGAPSALAASEMTASDELVAVLKQEEGFAEKPYWDHSQYTIGYGTRCPDDMVEYYQENGITKEAAETLLRNYLSGVENTINKKFIDAYGLTLTQGQFDALISFTYNCGSGWINDTSGTFHNAIKNGETGSELIRAFSLWCSASGQILPGLVRRRLCEANMYLNGVYSKTKPDNFCYVYYDATGGSVSYRIQGYDSELDTKPAYTPTYEGRTFLGWYTAQTGGTKVTKLTQSMSGDTLYARWDGEAEEPVKLPEAGITVTVTGTDVNLRKGPGTNYTIVGTANKGDQILVKETASCDTYNWGGAGEKWICLRYTNFDQVVAELEKETETTEPTEPTEEPTEAPTEEPTEPTEEPTEAPTEEPTEPTEEPTEAPTEEPTEPTEEPTEAPTEKPAEPETEPTEPAAPAAVTGKVKANGGLALREGPGTGYAVKKYLPNGTKVTILETQTPGHMTWGRIEGGWISMDYVVLDKTESSTAPKPTEPAEPETKPTEPEETKPETTSVTGKVKANGGLAVRKGPGTTYAVRKYLDNGTKVTVTEQQQVNGVKWGKIESGWICMDYVVLDKTDTTEATVVKKTVTADCLRIRQSASTSAKIVGYLYEGAKVTILETKKVDGMTWGRIEGGWISMDYVK